MLFDVFWPQADRHPPQADRHCILGDARTSGLTCGHVWGRLTDAPPVLAARLTVVLPPERPEFRCHGSRTGPRFVTGLRAAPRVPTAAFIRIGFFVHPSEFGANLLQKLTLCKSSLQKGVHRRLEGKARDSESVFISEVIDDLLPRH
jgi:hypothetical protein